MKPLWRWTISGVISELGWEIFSESVRHATKVYPEFDFVVCYNNVTAKQQSYLESLPIGTFPQQEWMTCVEHKKGDGNCKDFTWKIIPPRLRNQSHELWVDNDIVIRDRIPDIDKWLTKNTGLISVGFDSFYGRFKDQIDPEVDCCAGLFGLPPYFSFRERIAEVCHGQPLVDYDEQGMIVYIISNIPEWIAVSYDDFRMWGLWQKEFGSGLPYGLHFVRANDSDYMKSWAYYKTVSMP